jgi:HSP20 family molecular chaperone IbpA
MPRRAYKDDDPIDRLWNEDSEELRGYKFLAAEPLLEIRDEGRTIKILVEANGSREGDVVVERIRNRSVDLSLKFKGRAIRKRVELPVKVRSSGYMVKLKNGVAQIIFHKS